MIESFAIALSLYNSYYGRVSLYHKNPGTEMVLKRGTNSKKEVQAFKALISVGIPYDLPSRVHITSMRPLPSTAGNPQQEFSCEPLASN